MRKQQSNSISPWHTKTQFVVKGHKRFTRMHVASLYTDPLLNAPSFAWHDFFFQNSIRGDSSTWIMWSLTSCAVPCPIKSGTTPEMRAQVVCMLQNFTSVAPAMAVTIAWGRRGGPSSVIRRAEFCFHSFVLSCWIFSSGTISLCAGCGRITLCSVQPYGPTVFMYATVIRLAWVGNRSLIWHWRWLI